MKHFASFLLIVSMVGAVLVHGRGIEHGAKRLIKTSETTPGQWMTENEILGLIEKRVNFMDVTDFDDTVYPQRIVPNAIPSTLRFNATVQRVLTNLNSPRIQDFVSHFSSYFNRYYTTQGGRESQLWLLEQVSEAVAQYNGEVVVSEVNHGYLQRSIIARLVGADPTLRSEVVIIGGHLDSVTRGANGQAPGADDNASGSVVVLEALRAIVEAGVIFNRTVEFHWYAAEEVGLYGSQAIAQQYRTDGVNVVGMLNLDVVGYYVDGVDEIAIYNDYGNPDLIAFTRLLTDGYLSYGRRSNTCGYGCSDHVSFYRNGFPAVFAAEAIDNPYMHTVQDTIDKVGFPQVAEFVKLAVGFVVELGEPSRL